MKRITVSCFVIAAGVFLVFCFQRRDLLVQEWRLLELHSTDPEVRRVSALHLGRRGSERAARGLISLLEREADGKVRDEAALALGEIGPSIGPAGVAALLREIAAHAERSFA